MNGKELTGSGPGGRRCAAQRAEAGAGALLPSCMRLSRVQSSCVQSSCMRLFCLLLIFLGPVVRPVSLQAQPREVPFREGESLTYAVNYRWGGVSTDVGEATASLRYEDDRFHAVVEGSTYKFYDLFFKVRERFESKFDGRTLRPVWFHRDTHEGKYEVTNLYHFEPQGYGIRAQVRKSTRPPRDTLLQGNANTYDLVSLFYVCRTLDFSKVPTGVQQPVSFAIDASVYNLYYIYHGPEVKKIPGLGTFRTLKFTARVVAGEVFTGKEEMTIWVTDDGNKIPLLFESPIIVGKVSGRLMKWDGLKYPLTSKIK